MFSRTRFRVEDLIRADPFVPEDHTKEELFTLAALASRERDNDPFERLPYAGH